MSARDVMLNAGLPHYSEGGCMGLDEFERREVVESIIDAAISALTSSGYRILGPDELDAVTVEKFVSERIYEYEQLIRGISDEADDEGSLVALGTF